MMDYAIGRSVVMTAHPKEEAQYSSPKKMTKGYFGDMICICHGF